MPAWVTSALAEAYRAKGIKQLYSHQASTAELVRDSKNVVVVTPTSSGKTLGYNLPALNAVLENPNARALYLFPLKHLPRTNWLNYRTLRSVSKTVLEFLPTTATLRAMHEKRSASTDTSS
jgi:DEAD/DEAH box helicase domain-containing protein